MQVKAIGIEYCNRTENLWEDYFLFLMRHYEELGLPYDFEMTLSFIGNPILAGNAIIAREQATKTIVGAIGFVFGTGGDQFEDHTICQVETVYIDKRWRRKPLFLTLLCTFASYLKREHPRVQRIQFWSPADRPDFVQLFEKISTLMKMNDKPFGSICLYHTDTERILAVCSKYMERRSVHGEHAFS